MTHNHPEKNSAKSKFAVAAIIGAAAGVVAGLLTAPRSGKQTRADLKRKADELKDKAVSTGEDVAADVKDKAGELKSKAEHSIDRAKSNFKK